MAQLALKDPFETCPYNPAHQILRSRLQFHLVKCERNHPNAEILTCPFNATHRIKLAEKQFHINNCPDRRVVEAHKYHTADELTGQALVSAYVEPAMPPNNEDWDTTEVLSTYDPNKYIKEKNVLRKLQGATKSERKNFNLKERHRFDSLDAANSSEAKGVKEGGLDNLLPLRKPRSEPAALKALLQNSKLGMGRGRVANQLNGSVPSGSTAFMPRPLSSSCLGLGRGRGYTN